MNTAQLQPFLILSICIHWSLVYADNIYQVTTPAPDFCELEKGCPNNTKCYSKKKNYVCVCIDGKKLGATSCIEIDCPSIKKDINSEKCKPDRKSSKGTNFFCSVSAWTATINKHCEDYKRNVSNVTEFSLANIATTVGNMINDKPEWNKMEKAERHEGATLLLNCTESTVTVVAATMSGTEYNVTTTYVDVQIQALRGSKGTTVFLAKENEVDFQWEKDKSKQAGFAAASLIIFSEMESMMEDNDLEMNNKKYGTEYLQLNSQVLTAMVTSYKTRQNTTFTIRNKKEDVEDYTVCVYWDKSRNIWSTSGCSKVSSNHTHTVCRSTHLSSFAVLVALYKVEGPGLSTITYIGIILSLLCLLIAIITFIMCRAIQSTRNTIHTHLCLCLFVAELLFLIGLSATGSKAVCGAIAGILHYLFLTCFMWMLLEGIQLYLMMVKVFLSQSLRGKYTYPVAYGIPAIIVIISAASNPTGYGTREYCWLSLERGFRWSFVGPLCVICLVNLAFLILTIWKLVQKFNTINPERPILQKMRIFIVTAFAQLVLLGCSWIFGVFHFQERTIALAYIFTILNSFQGVFIFILHCLNNKQVRDEYRRCIARFSVAMKISKYTTFADSSHRTTSTRAQMKETESSA
ncbi:adhesion G protein-coupled receptor E5-like [Mustelus asterias]